MSNIFGSMFFPHELIKESENLLKQWFPQYLAEIETRVGLDSQTLVIPKNYSQRNTLSSNPGEELPRCVILIPGMVGRPTKNGYGAYSASWRLGVGTLVAGSTEDEAFFLASLYGTAVMAIFEHHPSINGSASDTDLFGYSLDDLPVGSEVYKFRSAAIQFDVKIDNIVQKGVGPKVPETPYGTAEKVVITSVKDPV